MLQTYFLYLGHGKKSYGSTPSHLLRTGALPLSAQWPIFPSSRTVILFREILIVTRKWKPSLETRLWVRWELHSIQKRETLECCHSLHVRDFFPWSQYYSRSPLYLRGLQNPTPEKLEVPHLHRMWQGIKYGKMCVSRQGSEIVVALFERSKPVRVLANRVTGIGICSY